MNFKNQPDTELEVLLKKNAINVLLVDDKEENLIALESLLKKEEENVNYILCRSGEEALKNALKQDIGLILLDVQMPGMNGYEVAKLLKNNSRTSGIPVIFVTAIDQDIHYVMEGFEVGAVDYLFKPLNPFITKAKVNAFLKMHLHRLELENKNILLKEQQKDLEEALEERKKAEEELKKVNLELRATHNSLTRLNTELEERVSERTKELEKSKEELNESNIELRKKNDQLKKINSDLDNFIYTASHDLKAPISNIEGLVDALKLEFSSSDEDIHGLLQMITQSVERFKNTILDLTNIMKVQNEENLNVASLNIKALVEEVCHDIQDLINTNHATITVDLKVPRINFSKKNFRSILYNLISNAIKYRSPDRPPEVAISTYTIKDIFVLSVKDNGLGIKAGDIPKVFKMFKRLHAHVEGTGIGMYIVKRMIDNFGGRIEIQSKVGKGSEFLIYLPKENIPEVPGK